MTTFLDADIRAALHARIDGEYPAGSVVIDEFGLERMCIADIGVVSPAGIALYEIKSDADSTRRLKWQVSFYNRIGARCTLAAGPRLIEKATALVPEWWGVLRVDDHAGAVQMVEIRPALPNPQITPLAVVRPLWSTETWKALQERGWSKGHSRLGGYGWSRMLAERLTIAELQQIVFTAVRARLWTKRKAPRVVAPRSEAA